MKGIILLSIGHPSYAKWCHNMAVSIRVNSPDIPIHVVTDGNFPAESWHSCVDKITKMEYSDCHEPDGKIFPAKAKLSLFKYSEFDQTIYLDVDGLLLKDITPLFDQNTFFQVQVNGVSTLENDNLDASLWVKSKQIFEKFDLKEGSEIPGTNSSFWYFTKEADTLFNQALTNLETPFRINELRYKWGQSGAQPDELYMNIALAQLGLMPDMKPVLYLRKRGTGKYVGLDQIEKDFYILGCWGNVDYNHFEISGTGDKTTGLYNKICAANYEKFYGDRKLFTDHFYQLITKKVYSNVLRKAKA